MAKRIEDMTREEVLAEFESDPAFYVPRRRGSLELLTLRVPADVKRRLAKEAKRRGLAGYTIVAREYIESGLRGGSTSKDNIVSRVAKETAREVVTQLRQSHRQGRGSSNASTAGSGRGRGLRATGR